MVAEWKLWTRGKESVARDSSTGNGDEDKREERKAEVYVAALSIIGFVAVWLGLIYGWA